MSTDRAFDQVQGLRRTAYSQEFTGYGVAEEDRSAARRKNLTSEDLTVLLLHEQSRSIAALGHGIESIAEGLRELKEEALPLLTQSKDIAEIMAELTELRGRVH